MVFENYGRFAVSPTLPPLVPPGCTAGRDVLLVLMTFHYCLLPPALSLFLPLLVFCMYHSVTAPSQAGAGVSNIWTDVGCLQQFLHGRTQPLG